jgi:hypothetical protein
VPVAILLQASMTIAFQRRLGARAATILAAVASHRYAAIMLLPAVGLLAAAGHVGHVAGGAMVLAAALFISVASMFHASGAISLGHELADERYLAAYQGAFTMGRSLQLSIGPILVTSLIVTGRLVGLSIFAGLLIVAPVLVQASTSWAERHGPRVRPQPEPQPVTGRLIQAETS